MRNIINTDAVDAFCMTLGRSCSPTIQNWINSTFRRWLIHTAPAVQVITQYEMNVAIATAEACGKSREAAETALLKKFCPFDVDADLAENQKWIPDALAAKKIVLYIAPWPRSMVVRQKDNEDYPDHVPYPECDENGVLDPKFYTLGDFEHWLDYLKTVDTVSQGTDPEEPQKQLRHTVPDLIKAVNAWEKAQMKKKLEAEEAEDIYDIRSKVLEGTGYSLVVLRTQRAFTREGKLMSHCVAGYYDRSGVIILSLRHKDSIRPLATLELNRPTNQEDLMVNYRINQEKAFGNAAVTDEHKRLIRAVFAEKGITMPKHDSKEALEKLKQYIAKGSSKGVQDYLRSF